MAAALPKNYALHVLELNRFQEMRDLKQLLARNVALHQLWRNSVMGWMWASKHLHVRLPRDVALMIGKMIWVTRTVYESPSMGGFALAYSHGSRKKVRTQDASVL